MAIMSEISALISGFNQFQQTYRRDHDGKFKTLRDFGQSPEILMIACCDSRVDPAIITNSGAGDILVVRNIANLVPPFSDDGQYRDIHAAIEYAVCYLRVRDIIVMGHSHCGGIRSLVSRLVDDFDPSHPLDEWMSIAESSARDVMSDNESEDLSEIVCACSRRNLKLCLENLQTYPWVANALAQKNLTLHGWYFSLSDGVLENFDQQSGEFSLLT